METRVATAVRLPASIHRRLQETASDRDVSVNLLVTRAVSEFLDRIGPAETALRPGSKAAASGFEEARV